MAEKMVEMKDKINKIDRKIYTTFVKLTLVSVALYLIFFYVPVNAFIDKIEEKQNVITINRGEKDLGLISIWVNPNVLNVLENEGFIEADPNHFISNGGEAGLKLEKISSIPAYIEMISDQRGSTITVDNGWHHFEYECVGNSSEVERVSLIFERGDIFFHLICWGILTGVLLLCWDKIKRCRIILYYKRKKSFLFVLLAFAFTILWIPLSILIRPTEYTIQNKKNIVGNAVSNIWINDEWFQIVSNSGYEKIETGHYLSTVENSELIIKKKPSISSGNDSRIHIIASGEGAFHLIKNKFEVFTVDSYDNTQIISVEVSIPSEGGSIWSYIRIIVFSFIVVAICIIYKQLERIIKDKGKNLVIQNGDFIRKFEEKFVIISLFCVFFMATFGTLFRQIYCTDDVYGAYRNILSGGVVRFEIDGFGRPVATVIGFLLHVLIKGYPYSYNGIPSLIIFMLACVISCCIVFEILKKQLNTNFLNYLIVFILAGLMILNPLMGELADFNSARSMYVWAVPFALWAAKNFLEKQKVTLISIFLLTISIFTYQAYGAYFIIICCIVMNIDYIYSCSSDFDRIKFGQLARRYVNCAICYIIPCALNKLWLSVAVSAQHYKMETVSSMEDLLAKWNTFCWWISQLVINGRGYMTDNIFGIVVVVSGLIFLLKWHNAKKINKLTVLVATVIAFFVCFSSIFYFQFFMKSIWIDARTCAALLGLPAILIISGLSIWEKEKKNSGDETKKKDCFQVLFFAVCVFFWGICLKDAQTNAMKLYAANVMDYERTQFYLTQIEKYENETGNKITDVGILADESPTWYYSDFSGGDDSTTFPKGSVYEATWSRDIMVALVSGEKLGIESIDNIPDIIVENWKGKNWNGLDEEQVICIKNKAYIILY